MDSESWSADIDLANSESERAVFEYEEILRHTLSSNGCLTYSTKRKTKTFDVAFALDRLLSCESPRDNTDKDTEDYDQVVTTDQVLYLSFCLGLKTLISTCFRNENGWTLLDICNTYSQEYQKFYQDYNEACESGREPLYCYRGTWDISSYSPFAITNEHETNIKRVHIHMDT